MRSYGLVLAALLSASLTTSAQQAPQTQQQASQTQQQAPQTQQQAPVAAPAAPAGATLDDHLAKWEAAMKTVETLGAKLTRIDKDPTFDRVQKLTGVAYYMKVGTGATVQNLALLEMTLDGQKEPKEKFICTGTYIYSYAPEQKEIRYYELPKPKPGQVADDNLMSLLFGMKADDAKRRYELKLAKEDTHYIYVDIAPRSPADKADFQRAQLILNKSNYLPRRLSFEHANGSEVTWDIPNLQVGMALDRRAFDAPQAPPGWKTVAGENRRQTARPAAPAPAPTPPAGK